MRDYLKFYIDGRWVDPIEPRSADVINPATEKPAGRISLGSAKDVDRAVEAARKAFQRFSRSSREDRVALLSRIAAEYERRKDELAAAITEEMGAPLWFAARAHVPGPQAHLHTAIAVLKKYQFEELRGSTMVMKEPIGVCGFITPWNWPLNQLLSKLAPALAVGCTMVVKPARNAPFSAHLIAEICDAAGVPPGVVNFVNGNGAEIGAAIATHPDVDMVSITGSTQAGVDVAKHAAASVKRVHQELGGKSANIVLNDADFGVAITAGVRNVMFNSGQTCAAPTRMLVPANRMAEVKALAKQAAESMTIGDPSGAAQMGPVVSASAWRDIQDYIRQGIEEGATLVSGGLGKPEGLETGYYVKPTVFADVRNDMKIAREEIFGPVLAVLSYQTEGDAIAIANDSPFGLAAFVQSTDIEHAREVSRHLRAGQVLINGAQADYMAPFGGYKQSGNGREWGDYAFAEFLELKAVLGYVPRQKTAE